MVVGGGDVCGATEAVEREGVDGRRKAGQPRALPAARAPARAAPAQPLRPAGKYAPGGSLCRAGDSTNAA